MYRYYFSCGGSCNGPVIVEAGNINEAKLLAELDCDCSNCCQFLGCDGAGCAGATVLTESQKQWRPDDDFVRKARLVKAKGAS